MKIIPIVALLAIAGCASNSGVIPMGKDTFTVTRQAATGFSGSGTLKAEALQEANQWCGMQKKTMEVVSITEAKPPYIMGNFPKADIVFKCT